MEAKSSVNNLSFQLLYSGGRDGIAIKKMTENVVKDGFLPALERLLNKYGPQDKVISIDSITCDVSVEDNDLNDTLTQKIIQQLEKQLIAKLSLLNQDKKTPTVEMRFAEALIFYLENGHMPWFMAITSRQQLNDFVIQLTEGSTGGDGTGAILKALRHEAAVFRICNDFDDSTFWRFLTFLLPNADVAVINNWQKDHAVFIAAKGLHINEIALGHVYKRTLLKSISLQIANQSAQSLTELNSRFVKIFVAEAEPELSSFNKLFSAEAVQLTNKISNELLWIELNLINSSEKESVGEPAQIASTSEQEKTDREIKAEGKDEENVDISSSGDPKYINNSGLVIIAPYLGMFFRRANVVDDDKITNNIKAVTLLHYIASGDTSFAEFEIVLPKLLCGLAPDFAVSSQYQITPADVELVDELLHSVINNWSILKNTSIAGLRSTFLLREGKLTAKNKGHHLKVQQNSVDVLLDHLPWNIGIIKLAWMKDLLNVDWV